MAKRICDFEDFLPAALYWDANFVVNFAHEAAVYHQPAADFLRRLEEGHTVSYVSTLTLDEVYFILLQANIERDHTPRPFWRVYNSSPAAIEPYIEALEDLTEELYTHPRVHILAAQAALSFDALTAMRRHHLLPRDAYHLAIMRHHNILNLVTLDADFLRVPNIVIHTCVPAILAQGNSPPSPQK